MGRVQTTILAAIAAAALVGCGADLASGTGATDAGAAADVSAAGDIDAAEDATAGADAAEDATIGSDAAVVDTGVGDSSAGDTGAADVVPADASSAPKATAWGTVTGACGVLAAELKAPTPSFLVSTYTFAAGSAFDPGALDPDAKARYDGPNAGGSSKCSEVMTMQQLVDCEGASDILREVEISHTRADTAITDFSATIAGTKVGVSVTRAYLGPKVTSYTEADATKLLTKKLEGILESTAHVAPEHKWSKQILSVWTLQPSWVPTLQAAWSKLDPALRSDTVVLVTIEQGAQWIVPEACGAPK